MDIRSTLACPPARRLDGPIARERRDTAKPGPGGAGAPDQAVLAALSIRERELVTLVARGCTDTQIATELYISVNTVRSHLDRIRDKTGCRRTDLTRLALQAELA